FLVRELVGDLGELYGEGDAVAAREFGTVLDEEQPDVVHLHSFTRAVSTQLVREARCRGIGVVFTYHTPTVSCPRGTLMRWGRTVCDGALERMACAGCVLHGLGVSKAVSRTLARVPPVLGRALARRGASGGVWTALRMSALVQQRHDAVRVLFA